MIAAVVLAAGSAVRFGGVKMIASLDGVPLVRHVVDRLRVSGFDPVLVAVRDEAVIAAALHGTGATLVRVRDPDAGLAASLCAVVSALPTDCDAFIVALGDQPLLDREVLAGLRAVWVGSNAAAVVPVYRDIGRGNPVLFDATLRAMILDLTGDHGARDLLRRLGDRVAELQVDQDAPRDVDTPGDLDEVAKSR